MDVGVWFIGVVTLELNAENHIVALYTNSARLRYREKPFTTYTGLVSISLPLPNFLPAMSRPDPDCSAFGV